MKTSATFLIFCAVLMGNAVKSQICELQNVDLYNLDGVRISASDLASSNAPLVMVFWNSNDMKSFDQLLMVNEEYQDRLEGRNIKVVGICTDLNGTLQQVKPLVYANNISFEIYIDKNNDFKRAMNVSGSPYVILVDGNTNGDSRQIGYCINVEEFINGKIGFPLAVIPANE
jgi:cytochrome c biogenesis protein CcmG, thiol:disulfide interchange protein DsbE